MLKYKRIIYLVKEISEAPRPKGRGILACFRKLKQFILDEETFRLTAFGFMAILPYTQN
jgi:hypothetical protein